MVEVLVDGIADDRVAADDRGLLYGDHLFETIAFVGRRAPLWRCHMDRLQRDARRLLMPPPEESLLAQDCQRLVESEGNSVVRITLTRGSGGRAYEPLERPQPRRIVARRAWPPGLSVSRAEGLTLHTSPVRLSVGGILAGIKHGNRLEQVLAAERARRAGVDEAVLLDIQDRVIEAIAGNLAVELRGRVLTPDLSTAGVAGVGLAWLSDRLRAAGQPVPERTHLTPGDLARADGIMVINSVAGIRPARSLDGRPLAISETCRRWQAIWDDGIECES
jgi:4-amino-4-deoxychorismate lyase